MPFGISLLLVPEFAGNLKHHARRYTMAREWDTPIRAPWNPLIKQSLDAIDRHEHLYRSTGDGRHARLAHQLRQYVAELKDWILSQET